MTKISESDCFVIGTGYPGPDLQNKTGVGSATECFIAALSLNGCNFFTYDTCSQSCWLKSAKYGNQFKQGAISGGISECSGTTRFPKE